MKLESLMGESKNEKESEAEREREIQKAFRKLCNSKISDASAVENYNRYKARYIENVIEGRVNIEYPYIMKEAYARYLKEKGISVI